MKTHHWLSTVAIGIVVGAMFSSATTLASIQDFNEWTQVQDPADPNFGGVVDSSSQITLTVLGPPAVPGTDIGYQSVNGADVAGSTSGWAFDPAQSFGVSVDFNLSFGTNGLPGDFHIGFGIGENRSGADSAGVGLTTFGGAPLAFGGAARVDDILSAAVPFATPGAMAGQFFVSYVAGTGEVAVGVNTDLSNAPTEMHSLGPIRFS